MCFSVSAKKWRDTLRARARLRTRTRGKNALPPNLINRLKWRYTVTNPRFRLKIPYFTVVPPFSRLKSSDFTFFP